MSWILELWNTRPKGFDMGSAPQKGTLKCKCQDLASPTKVSEALAAFDGDGWVMLTDKVEELTKGSPIPEGIILAAEAVSGDKSLHIRQHQTQWRSWTYEQCLNQTRDHKEGWLFEETLERIPRGYFTYEVEWFPDHDGVYRPITSRLKHVCKTSTIDNDTE